jgi:hypothetical protein
MNEYGIVILDESVREYFGSRCDEQACIKERKGPEEKAPHGAKTWLKKLVWQR